MRETGKITEINGAIATIVIARSEKCHDCNACRLFGENTMAIEARNHIQAKVGDYVELEVRPGHVVKASMAVFIFPIALMMVGYFLGMRMISARSSANETAGMIGAGVGLILGLVLNAITSRMMKDDHPLPEVIGFATLEQSEKS